MSVTQAKLQAWVKLIQLKKLQDVLDDIQSIHIQVDSKLNEKIFKLLLHLYRTADECKEQSSETGKEMAALTKLLCSLLINIPNNNNFVKCLFKIARYLISLNLYEDAAEICCYLQPGKMYDPQNDTIELLAKVLSLWQGETSNAYLLLTKQSFNEENYNNLKNAIAYEMRMIQILHKNYTKPLIMRISAHLDTIATIDKGGNKYFQDFLRHMQEYLAGAQLCLEQDEKYIIYCHTLHIICHIICKSINMADVESTRKTLNELFSDFENLLAEDEECHQCFQQFQNLCATLLVPVESFANDTAKNLQNIVSCNSKIAQRYGYEALKWNAFSTAEIGEPLFMYLERCVKADKCLLVDKLLDTSVLLETMNLFIHMNVDAFYMREMSLKKCKWCLDKVCTVKKDLYNAIVMQCRFFTLVCKFSVKTLPEEVCVLARKILEQNANSIIREMRECRCTRWIQLWSTCRTLIYNIGILSEHVYKEGARLFALLCRCIFQLRETDSSSKYFKSPEDLENSLSFALYKLSVIYYNNGVYRRAMTVCALHALLTYDQPSTKAFHVWANIKKHAPEIVRKLSMIECLRSDKDQIKDVMNFLIDTSKYDLVKLRLREVKSLIEEEISFTNCVSALLEEFERLEPSKRLYARAVQLLGHYLLNFEFDSSVLEYHKRAMSRLKQDVELDSLSVLCFEANLHFFTFLEELHAMNKQTQVEMENTKFALYAPKLPELRETKSPNVVPAYTMINVKKDVNLVVHLQKCLKKWSELFKCDIGEIIKNLEPNLILDTMITAGEYCRLYRYEDCEAKVWKLAHRLASEMDDHRKIIYVVSRCISSRQINYDWIATAKEYAIKCKDSKDENTIRSIAIFWISLADFCFECGKCDDAKQLLTEASNLSGISLLATKSIYLLSLDTIIRNINLYEDNMQHEDYTSYITKSLFAGRRLHQELVTTKWKSQVEYLFSYDVLFTTAINLSMRTNSLLSFRGISTDLLDDCEVKLQGLERILDIETFQLSMTSSKSVPTSSTHLAVTPTRNPVDPVRDLSQHGSSPVLAKKIFDLPKFSLHENCDCYKCRNVSYQYLVFATTYIRAQLYASQGHIAQAFDHFHGAFKIREKLFREEKSSGRSRDKIGAKRSSWHARLYVTDYVQLLIDFCYFLKTSIPSRQQEAYDIANLAIDVCHQYKLEGHPVYVSAQELAIDNDFQSVLTSSDCTSEFMVPQSHDIDVSEYAAVPTVPSLCVTPSAQKHVRRPLSGVRRKRNPVALKIAKVDMIWSDDEDDDDSSSSPSVSTRLTKTPKPREK
ncbi:uncharacterized protein LOC105280654 isoform X2 [Ooceraea biroi]|uniref:uncharacterized protein LOC105280654 isoform X2 n=1 Tax=Ooceraea biroi TaxID=2015173 RepID=UPI0005BBD80B|nr:uncharacterized protein LOC105280654 isoform X2 [Ooceraea biroi]